MGARSATPTFVALKLFINIWRWQGVPFYIRSGKRLARKVTEAIIQFRNVPLCVLPGEACGQARPNALVIRIQPDEGFRLSFSTRLPGREERISQENMDFRYADLGVRPSGGYEQVLLDGMTGRPSYFWRADGTEASWRVVSPMLDVPTGGLPGYEPGSWGPGTADELLRRNGRTWLPSY